MKMTSEVFTPTTMPRATDVDRKGLSKELDRLIDRKGYFISVLGTTKLGKTTLVKTALNNKKIDRSIFINGESLNGVETIWYKLGTALGIPVSIETGTVSGDKSKWAFFSRFNTKLAFLAGIEAGAEIGGEHHLDNSKSATFHLDAETEIIKAIGLLKNVVIAIDDFHFISDVNRRRSLLRALRPVALAGATVILITLPHREADASFGDTNTGGRHKVIRVPMWSSQDLMMIAAKGFKALNIEASMEIVDKLVEESYGSPQIMQELCLAICEDKENNIFGEHEGLSPYVLRKPSLWLDFFNAIVDYQSKRWLQILIEGPKQKRFDRQTYTLGGNTSLDGYQLIFFVLRDMKAPPSVSLREIKEAIGVLLYPLKDKAGRTIYDIPKVNAMNLDAKASKIHALAHKNLEGDSPQPVLEYIKDLSDPLLNILDPQLRYTLYWHSNDYLKSKQKEFPSRFD